MNDSVNVFNGDEINLDRQLVRNACMKVANLLNVAMPDNNLIAFIFSEFQTKTPKTFKKCCIKISKTWDGRSFPGLPMWKKYMEVVLKDIKNSKKIDDDWYIAESERPTKDDWNKFYDILDTLEKNSSIKSFQCSDSIKEKRRMADQVKKMQMLRGLSKQELRAYYCKREKCNKCDGQTKECKSRQVWVASFKKD